MECVDEPPIYYRHDCGRAFGGRLSVTTLGGGSGVYLDRGQVVWHLWKGVDLGESGVGAWEGRRKERDSEGAK